jgi:hypothetical protein
LYMIREMQGKTGLHLWSKLGKATCYSCRSFVLNQLRAWQARDVERAGRETEIKPWKKVTECGLYVI